MHVGKEPQLASLRDLERCITCFQVTSSNGVTPRQSLESTKDFRDQKHCPGQTATKKKHSTKDHGQLGNSPEHLRSPVFFKASSKKSANLSALSEPGSLFVIQLGQYVPFLWFFSDLPIACSSQSRHIHIISCKSSYRTQFLRRKTVFYGYFMSSKHQAHGQKHTDRKSVWNMLLS